MAEVLDVEAFGMLMEALCSAFRIEIDEAILEGYRIGLEDLPITAIRGAVYRAMRECKFMPSAPELRELAGVARIEGRAIKAWDAFRRAIRIVGPYRSIDFDDPIVNAVIRNLGGWVAICDTEAGEPFDVWLRKEFERVYLSFSRSGVHAEQARPLIGICDGTNSQNGHDRHIEAPVKFSVGLPPMPGLVIGHSAETPGAARREEVRSIAATILKRIPDDVISSKPR